MAFLFKIPQRMEDLALFTRHVAGAMEAHAPLPAVLRAYAEEAEGGGLTRVARALADRVEQGVPLSTAMAEQPRWFSAAYRKLVELGEQGRTLGGVMNQLAAGLEENLKTYEYFRRAAVYPLIVLSLITAELAFAIVVIVPKLQDIGSSLGEAPRSSGLLPTDLIFVPRLMIPFLIMLVIGIVFLLACLLGLRVRGLGYGRLSLQLPLIGPVLRRAETAPFANLLALLLASRIPLAEALGLLSQAAENRYVGQALGDFKARYESGERLGAMMATQPLFPATMATMIAAAEDQGGLIETLRALGHFYGERTAHGLTVLREVFEPLMLLVVGVLVALILLSLYTPLFTITRMIR